MHKHLRELSNYKITPDNNLIFYRCSVCTFKSIKRIDDKIDYLKKQKEIICNRLKENGFVS